MIWWNWQSPEWSTKKIWSRISWMKWGGILLCKCYFLATSHPSVTESQFCPHIHTLIKSSRWLSKLYLAFTGPNQCPKTSLTSFSSLSCFSQKNSNFKSNKSTSWVALCRFSKSILTANYSWTPSLTTKCNCWSVFSCTPSQNLKSSIWLNRVLKDSFRWRKISQRGSKDQWASKSGQHLSSKYLLPSSIKR